MKHRTVTSPGWAPIVAAFAILVVGSLVASPWRRATAAEVTLSPAVIGKTPAIVGYNAGHFMPGSNTASWWKYSGVNGARVWSTPAVVEGNDDNSLWGDGVISQEAFLSRRAALRANPMGTPIANVFINWPYFEDRYANNPTTGNVLNLNYAFSQLHDMGIEPVVEIHRSTGAYPFAAAGTPAGWGDRWEQWQHFYAQAFYLGKNFDVARYQMYNEPNHSSNAALSQSEYIERLQLASDAVQAAIADVNSLYGKSLDAQMHGPVTAGGFTLFHARPGGDSRDDAIGWGERVIDNLRTPILGGIDLKLIDTYAYQQYSGNGSTFQSDLANLQNAINADAPGENIRFAITELNVSTAGNFENTSETLDTPIRYTQMGSILSALANQQADELYVFKFSQTADSSASGVKKNGVHYVDNDSAPYSIGGSTKAAEVVRLYAKGFAGAKDLLQTPTATGSGSTNLELAASRDPATGRYSLMSSNSNASAQTLNLNLSNLGIAPGTYVTVEEVSAERHGEVREIVQVSAQGTISLSQPSESVFLVTAPPANAAVRLTLEATDDAMVKSGGNSSSNYGASENLYAKNNPSNAGARNVAFVKFDAGTTLGSSVDQAILRVFGENAGTAHSVITHVYGLLDDDWDEATITWDVAPNLAAGSGTIDDISHNFIEDVGGSAQIVGHFTGKRSARELMLDVTPFVREHPDREITFLITREVRFDGENVDDALSSLKLASKERAVDDGPQLILSLSANPAPGDFNGDGMVDGADLSAWTRGFGATGTATRGDGDADEDGDVDGADFLVWQRFVGAGVISAGAAARVPEPSTFWLMVAAGLFASSVGRRRNGA